MIMKRISSFCTEYILLFVIAFLMNIGIISACFDFIGSWKKILLVSSLITILKEQFIRHVNGKYQRNKY